MKAVQFATYGGPEVLQVRDLPDPQAGPEDLLVEVKTTTVNRLDLFQRDGSRPVGSLPFTPGLEAAGVVLQAAPGFEVGDRVLMSHGAGGYASKIAAPANYFARIPADVTFEQAAAVGLAGSTAWGSLFDLGNLQAGERVLIWAGSSGVGTLAIQLAKQKGAWVATTASTEERAASLRTLGADLVINHRQQDAGKLLQEVGGVQLVVELVSSTLQTSLNACTVGGRVVLIGNLGGQQATVDTQAWRMKRVEVVGGGQTITSVANEAQMLRLVAEKTLVPVIARTMPVEQAAEAHRLLASGEIQGKIVLTHA